MKKEKLKGALSRTLTVQQLRKVYDLLDDEEHPYEATVSWLWDKKFLLARSMRPEDKAYFQELVKTACDEVQVRSCTGHSHCPQPPL